jgi:hypothetical protein
MTRYAEMKFMSTSRKKPLLSEIKSGDPLPPHTLAYFQERLKNRIFNYVLGKFLEAEREGLTKAELARRIGKRPEIVTRLLGAPGNWTLDTVSDLLLGIAAEELEPETRSLLNRPRRNYEGIDWEAKLPLKPLKKLETESPTAEFALT